MQACRENFNLEVFVGFALGVLPDHHHYAGRLQKRRRVDVQLP
jgi:hypothetical protein